MYLRNHPIVIVLGMEPWKGWMAQSGSILKLQLEGRLCILILSTLYSILLLALSVECCRVFPGGSDRLLNSYCLGQMVMIKFGVM